MVNLSIKQIVQLWSRLEACYHDADSYGGTVCEIYAYTLQPCNPTAYSALTPAWQEKAERELSIAAWRSLCAVLNLFIEEHGGDRFVEIVVDGHKDWRTLDCEFRYRCHIEVIRRS